MPTAAEYRDAARRFRAAGENLLREAAEVARWAQVPFCGGPVRIAIDESLERVGVSLVDAGQQLTGLALVCDRRADVCVEFAGAVEHYQALTPVERLLRRPPSPPARWVEL